MCICVCVCVYIYVCVWLRGERRLREVRGEERKGRGERGERSLLRFRGGFMHRDLVEMGSGLAA